MGKQDELLDLVGQIYRAALVPAEWHAALHQTCELLNAESALFMINERPSRAPLFGTLYGMDPISWEIYANDGFFQHDIWLRRVLELNGPSTVVGKELVRDDVFRGSPWRNEFLRRWNIEDVISYSPAVPAGLSASVSFFRPPSAESFSGKDKETLALLTRHLDHSVNAHIKLAQLQERAAATEMLLERFSFGVMILNRRGELERMNRAAEAVVAAADGLLVRQHKLVAESHRDSIRLGKAIDAAIRGHREALPQASCIVIARPSMKRSYAIQTLPVQSESPPPEWCQDIGSAAAVVLISDPEQKACVPEQTLTELYGLTPREAQLAAVLASGETLGQISETMKITIGTARNHLKSVLHKTGCHRQAELVRLVQSSRILTGEVGDADSRLVARR